MCGLLTLSCFIGLLIFDGEWILAVLSVSFRYSSCSSLGSVIFTISGNAFLTKLTEKCGSRVYAAIVLIRDASQDTSMSMRDNQPWTNWSND